MIAGPGNAETGITCIMENRNYSMIVDFTHGKILVENNGHSVNPNLVSANDKTVIPAYNAVMQKFCEYVKTLNDIEYPVPECRLTKEETASATS